jgi:hypothetical protein
MRLATDSSIFVYYEQFIDNQKSLAQYHKIFCPRQIELGRKHQPQRASPVQTHTAL